MTRDMSPADVSLEGRLANLEAEVRRLTAESDQSAMIQMLLRDNAKRREAEDRLSRAQEWIQLAQEAGNAAAYTFDFTTNELSWSASTYALYGWPSSKKASVDNWLDSIHPEDRTAVEAVATAALSHGAAVKHEFRVVRADGEVRWIQDRGQVILDEKGQPSRLVGLNIDITDLKQAERRLDYIVGEVGHRFKNLLTVVQAMIEQSTRDLSVDPIAMRNDLLGRVGALARSKDLLLRHQLTEVPITELAVDQVYSVVGKGNPAVAINGPALELLPSAAQPLGMAMHELATNACKHGALKDEDGTLRIEWRCDEKEFSLSWRESWRWRELPKPMRKGFGSRITKDFIERSIGGKTAIELLQNSFNWSVTAPVERVIVPKD